jgi:hypothetical protein
VEPSPPGGGGLAAVAVETGGLLEKWRGKMENGRKRIWTWPLGTVPFFFLFSFLNTGRGREDPRISITETWQVQIS